MGALIYFDPHARAWTWKFEVAAGTYHSTKPFISYEAALANVRLWAEGRKRRMKRNPSKRHRKNPYRKPYTREKVRKMLLAKHRSMSAGDLVREREWAESMGDMAEIIELINAELKSRGPHRKNPGPSHAKKWSDYQKINRAADAADKAFSAALKKQFGSRFTGDLRYQSSKHNAATKKAAIRFREISYMAHKALLRARRGNV